MLEEEVDRFVWKEGQYERRELDSSGIYKSEIFPSLWRSVPALLKGDLMELLRVLQGGLKSEEHQAFVARLKQTIG